MPFPPPPVGGQDYDEAGPVVRPYTVTSGRTRPSRGRFDLVSMVVAVGSVAASLDCSPEQRAIVAMAQRPISLAELAVRLNLPASLVQVILGDLLDAELISISRPYPAGYYHRDTLEAIRDGLRAL